MAECKSPEELYHRDKMKSVQSAPEAQLHGVKSIQLMLGPQQQSKNLLGQFQHHSYKVGNL